jgi:hypothetical protein
MACTHSASNGRTWNAWRGPRGKRSIVAKALAAARLLRAYSAQVEAVGRLRNGARMSLGLNMCT